MRTVHLALAVLVGGFALACNSNTTVDRADDAPESGGVAGESSTTGGAGDEAGGAGDETGGVSPGEGGGIPSIGGAGGDAADAEAGDAGSDAGGSPPATGGAPVGGAGGAPGSGGASGASTGGTAPATGGTPTGGTAGAPSGGSPAGGTATGGAALGGVAGVETTGGTAGGGADETGGAGGAAGGDTTVRGRVIDFWGHPIPNVPVEIGGEVTLTGSDGTFTVAEVAAEYDASLVVDYLAPGRRIYGWVYQGLTRRDPTLQVYGGLPLRSGDFALSLTTEPFDADWNLTMSFGGPDGTSTHEDVGDNGIDPGSVSWRGPDTATFTVHGLLWQYDTTTELPISYLAYDSTLIALTEPVKTEFSLDLSPDSIASSNLRGEVLGSAANRTHSAFVRFATGAAIEVAREYEAPGTFSYLVPSLPGSSLTFAASVGSAFSPPLALAHVEGLAPGQDVEVTLPTPSTLLTPATAATDVTRETPFRFLPSPDSGGAVVVVFDRVDYYDGLYIVTAREEVTIPEVAGGAFGLQPAATYVWWVETHGEQSTVDELAGADGFLDAFSWDYAQPTGPSLGSGSYTMSGARSFTTAP